MESNQSTKQNKLFIDTGCFRKRITYLVGHVKNAKISKNCSIDKCRQSDRCQIDIFFHVQIQRRVCYIVR